MPKLGTLSINTLWKNALWKIHFWITKNYLCWSSVSQVRKSTQVRDLPAHLPINEKGSSKKNSTQQQHQTSRISLILVIFLIWWLKDKAGCYNCSQHQHQHHHDLYHRHLYSDYKSHHCPLLFARKASRLASLGASPAAKVANSSEENPGLRFFRVTIFTVEILYFSSMFWGF